MASQKLLDQVRAAIRRKHYSRRTEKTYVGWIKRYIRFHGLRHPKDMGEAELTAFLSHLSVNRNVAASTQNQALNALLFLYRAVLDRDLDWLNKVDRAKRSTRLPVVLTQSEVKRLLSHIEGVDWLIASLLYGGGLRLMECQRLRVKDLDFEYGEITVRSGKGNTDRRTILPESLHPSLREHFKGVSRTHARDLEAGFGSTDLPYALARKYPAASTDWRWQYVFPSQKRSVNRETGEIQRFHRNERALQRQIRTATKLAGITKRVSAHTFRHSFATHLIECGYDIRTVQDLLGHKNVRTTMIYTYVLNKGGRGVISPLDRQ